MTWRIEFDDQTVTVPHDCTIEVRSFSASDRGGSDRAELRVAGQAPGLAMLLNWLGQRLRIVNPIGRTVWRGLVSELALGFGGFTVGASLDEMSNRIAITYAAVDATGATTETTTAWLDNLESQAQFGVKELLFSAGESSAEQAAAKQAQLLTGLAWPLGVATVTPAVGATVRCIGLYHALGWRYYTNLAGRIENQTADGGEIAIGWQLTSAEIGIKRSFGIFHLGDQLGGPIKSDGVLVTGSASNNATFTVAGKSEGHAEYTASTIAFEVADDVRDAANGMVDMPANTFVKITGSANNTGIYWIKNKISDGHFEVGGGVSATIVTESAGPSITLRTGASLAVAEALTSEPAGQAITLTLVGYVLAQSFVPTVNMTAGKIALRIGKVGSPSDAFAVRICANSSGDPGTVLGSATIAAADLGDLADAWLTLPAVALTAGTTYWLKLERTGSTDAANYYQLGLSLTAYGACKAWNGSSWGAFTRDGAAQSVVFRLWDTEDTAVSLARIVSQCGQSFVTSITMDSTGLKVCQYADNRASGKQELEKLLDAGTATGARLIASVNELGALVVEVESTVNAVACPILQRDGNIRDAAGSPWEEGRLPVGEWVYLDGMPEDINSAWRISPIFVQAATYDVARRRIGLTPRNARQLLTLFKNG